MISYNSVLWTSIIDHSALPISWDNSNHNCNLNQRIKVINLNHPLLSLVIHLWYHLKHNKGIYLIILALTSYLHNKWMHLIILHHLRSWTKMCRILLRNIRLVDRLSKSLSKHQNKYNCYLLTPAIIYLRVQAQPRQLMDTTACQECNNNSSNHRNNGTALLSNTLETPKQDFTTTPAVTLELL